MNSLPQASTRRIGSSKIRNLLVATKAPDASPAVESILHNLHQDVRILLLCNGALAVRDELKHMLPHNPMTLISTTHGAYREESDDELYHLIHAGVGKTHVQDHKSLAQLFNQSGLHAESTSDIETMLWLKLAANCTINPLTAILHCLNGELPTQPEFQTMVPAILEELAHICPQDHNNNNNNNTEQQTLTPAALREFVDQVIHDTVHNKSSMLQDIEQRRPTEINYLNGFIVRKGIEMGIPTPVNQVIYDTVLRLNNNKE